MGSSRNDSALVAAVAVLVGSSVRGSLVVTAAVVVVVSSEETTVRSVKGSAVVGMNSTKGSAERVSAPGVDSVPGVAAVVVVCSGDKSAVCVEAGVEGG